MRFLRPHSVMFKATSRMLLLRLFCAVRLRLHLARVSVPISPCLRPDLACVSVPISPCLRPDLAVFPSVRVISGRSSSRAAVGVGGPAGRLQGGSGGRKHR